MAEEHKTETGHNLETILKFISDLSVSGPLHSTIYVQADNCNRNNKILYIFAYMESLEKWKVFCTIDVSFLPTGHNHEDIDHHSVKPQICLAAMILLPYQVTLPSLGIRMVVERRYLT